MILLAGASAQGKELAADLAARLGRDAQFDAGPLKQVVPAAWETARVLVLVCATGIGVRLVAPLLGKKTTDPGVVTIDDAGAFASVLCGGHEGGANLCARHIADLIGATPVITTASEARASRVIGLGCSSDATAQDILTMLPDPWQADCLATLDRKARQPAVREAAARAGLPLVSFSAAELARVPVPHPSEYVRSVVGTPSVCEAAALAESGAKTLLVEKQTSSRVTVALAERAAARSGVLHLLGTGPGDLGLLPPTARRVLRRASHVVGYTAYVESVRPLLRSAQVLHSSPIGEEKERAQLAVRLATEGAVVVLLSSGDVGVYAMASLALELSPPSLQVQITPGITASLAAAACLGAPLGHDHVVISLSDLLTPWQVIERRVQAAAEADLVTVFYNPRSARRSWQLDKALQILAAYRSKDTPVGVVTDATRAGEAISVSTLAAVQTDQIAMTSLVIVGARQTKMVGNRMVTPRGYDT